jgi:hypothetical protein
MKWFAVLQLEREPLQDRHHTLHMCASRRTLEKPGIQNRQTERLAFSHLISNRLGTYLAVAGRRGGNGREAMPPNIIVE